MRRLQEHIRTIELLLDADVLGALRYVNGLGHYRFTGLYVFESGQARSWYLVDRDELDPDESLLKIPLSDTYCAFVKELHAPFVVADAMTDERLALHPSRTAVRSYCGAPLLDAFGRSIGSLCHFDFDPILPEAGAFQDDEMLEAVAGLFSQKLAEQPPSS